MNLEEDFAGMTDIELKAIMDKNGGGTQAYVAALKLLKQREIDQKLQDQKEKQENKQWQNQVKALLEKTDHKTLWILVISGVVVLLTIFQLLKH